MAIVYLIVQIYFCFQWQKAESNICKKGKIYSSKIEINIQKLVVDVENNIVWLAKTQNSLQLDKTTKIIFDPFLKLMEKGKNGQPLLTPNVWIGNKGCDFVDAYVY